MDASDGTRDTRGVKDKVTNLTEEDIGGLELKSCPIFVSGGNMGKKTG